VERLEKVFALCDTKATGKTCPGIQGILEDDEEDVKPPTASCSMPV
jgi:ferritin-like metal-binding protein YciE